MKRTKAAVEGDRGEAPAPSARGVVLRLREAKKTVATAESCTGGLLAAALTSEPGSSAVFQGGIVAYSDAVKRDLLGVDEDELAEGAVSRVCAMAMARQARQRFATTLAVAVTGIAGPGGAVPGKPVGTVWFAVADDEGEVASQCLFAGNRDEVRRAAVAEALRLLFDAAAKA